MIKDKKIKKDFNELRGRFSKPKIKEIKRFLYEIENLKDISALKTKEIATISMKVKARGTKIKIYHLKNILI